VTRKRLILAALSAVMAACAMFGAAQEQAGSSSDPAPAQPLPKTAAKTSPFAAEATPDKTKGGAAPLTAYNATSLRIEGEKRFRTNCGRCHMAPHKFPPRTMATVVRHMRVRAMITDEDMRLILRYLTQ
jgi:mono/diheme cytochrome c family protein